MPPPTSLILKALSVTRLIKEERHYHKELLHEKQRLQGMRAAPETDVYAVKQQETVVDETLLVMPTVRMKLAVALEALITQLDAANPADTEETVMNARNAVEQAKKVLEEDHSKEEEEL
ncbi:tubulin binding cofactor A [Sphaerosporella brunnea]|uniref:Tubulin-specific chaperone A n=1 Tax=Sphaerosporella brunnea TaxID=1250544 RepID=A0A5J5F2E3_9PEZI|nr:tubulin binding cofactor A [Sphaerosporella brunnea]